MAEIEIREEVTQEFEERIQEMEANFARRRAEDVGIEPQRREALTKPIF